MPRPNGNEIDPLIILLILIMITIILKIAGIL